MATDQPPDPTPDDLLRRLSKRPKTDSRYKLEGEVARGGMGSIIKIWDEDLRRHLVMKVVLGKGEEVGTGTTPSVDSKQLARFLEEAQVTGQLDHPGIVPVHEVGLDSEGRVYFTMKLVKGRDLKHIFDLVFEGKEDWNETRALTVILKVCEAMAYAHAKGVIHRDLKPANVMVGSFGEVYVMDWGLSRVLGRNDKHDIRIKPEFTSSIKSVKTERRDAREDTPDSPIVTMDGDVMGTPAYMSPEQARGEIEKLGPQSDVYSIGAMLYHLLARQIPYVPPGEKITNRTVLARVLDGPPKSIINLRKGVPAELVAICERAMAREANGRYRDTIELATDLRAYLERRVVSAYETGTWAETRKWVQRNKALASSLAAVAIISLVAIAWVNAKNFEVRATNSRLNSQNQELVVLKNMAEAAAEAANARDRESRLLALSKDLEIFRKKDDDYSYARLQSRPACEWWLEEAHLLVEGRTEDPARNQEWIPGLHDVEKKLEDIRPRALPRTIKEVARDRHEFARGRELWGLEFEVAWISRMLGRSAWPTEESAEAALSKEAIPLDAQGLAALASRYSGPNPAMRGQEVKGLLLARRALAAGSASEKPALRVGLAWALFQSGQVTESLEEARAAIEDAPIEQQELLSTSVAQLRDTAGRWIGPESRRNREETLRKLTTHLASMFDQVDDRRTWRFSDSQDEYWHEHLAPVAQRLRELRDQIRIAELSKDGPSSIQDVQERMEALTVYRHSAQDWREAIEAIAVSDKYIGMRSRPGIRLATPQLGLVPIGVDPESGLWEFAHLASGSPARRGSDGKIILEPEMGLVFVLLPGGRIPVDESGDGLQDSGLTESELDPFFLSKFELTQEQATRLWPAWAPFTSPFTMTAASSLTWDGCVELLDHTEWLRLPSEAQWEYGCRAGSNTRWWTGNDVESLRGVANIRFDGQKEELARIVGQRRANKFGLHDVHGNVWEWCGDAYVGLGGDRRYGDGLCDEFDAALRVMRGGFHFSSAEFARSSARGAKPPDQEGNAGGLRPARAITP